MLPLTNTFYNAISSAFYLSLTGYEHSPSLVSSFYSS